MRRTEASTRGARGSRADRNRSGSVAESVLGPDRAQTTQDFAVGIGIFLLATAFVFAFLPSVMTPFSASAGGGETAQADRIAATIVDDLEDDVGANHIDAGEFESQYAGQGSDDLAADLGLRTVTDAPIDRVNVTIEPLDGGDGPVDYGPDPMAAGDDYEGADAVSATRIVTVDEQTSPDCDPACRLIVRVW